MPSITYASEALHTADNKLISVFDYVSSKAVEGLPSSVHTFSTRVSEVNPVNDVLWRLEAKLCTCGLRFGIFVVSGVNYANAVYRWLSQLDHLPRQEHLSSKLLIPTQPFD